MTKSQEYAAIETVRRYSVLAQESMAGTMFERIEEDWVGMCWMRKRAADAGDRRRGDDGGIYEGVEFPEAERQPS